MYSVIKEQKANVKRKRIDGIKRGRKKEKKEESETRSDRLRLRM